MNDEYKELDLKTFSMIIRFAKYAQWVIDIKDEQDGDVNIKNITLDYENKILKIV